jgi:hypothetical protein
LRALDVQDGDELVLQHPDQPADRLVAGRQLGEAAHLMDFHVADSRHPLLLPATQHDFADDEADDEQQRGRLHVVGAVDTERVVGLGEEQIEPERGADGDDRAADAATGDRHDQDDDHEHHRHVGGADV